jgi:hypothetical protein
MRNGLRAASFREETRSAAKGVIHGCALSAALKLCASKRRPIYRPPNPADCIDCREISAVEAMPCMRSLKSSALEAFSSAVS